MSAPLKKSRFVAAGTPFGKYQLLDCIAESVMSKVYRARLTLGKMNRLVVVKTLHPRYLTDQKSRDQFYREIQTSMALQHANIVQIHDFGEEEGCPFIVMEWVHGRNLKDVIKVAHERTGRGISLLISCYFIDQAAQGLEHAHSLKDKLTGESMNVVHRDLSPHNLIAGFDGTIKLIDFGIARMAHGDADTMSDQIWGKAGYFSPEQAQGARLDRRSDLFALGAVFFELLSGKKLFSGDDLMVSLDRIRRAETYVPEKLTRLKGLPEPLAQILTKSLRFKREDRYDSAGQFSKDIRDFVKSQPKSLDSSAVAQWMEQLFPGEVEKDLKKLRSLSESASASDESVPSSEPIEEELSEVVTLERPAPRPESTREVLPWADRVKELTVPEPAGPPRKPRHWLWLLPPALAGVALATYLALQPETVPVALKGSRLKLAPELDARTSVTIDGATVTVPNGILPDVSRGQIHRIDVKRMGFKPASKEFVSGQSVELQLLPEHWGMLTLNTVPEATAQISNGEDVWEKKTPFTRFNLRPGDYVIRLSTKDGKERTFSVTIQENAVVMTSEQL